VALLGIRIPDRAALSLITTLTTLSRLPSDKETNHFRILLSSGLLRGVRWFETDVSGFPIGPGQLDP
jgi:hypothetical protein